MVIASHMWGALWLRKHALFRSDNAAVVAILTSRTSKVPALMHLIRDLLLSAVHRGFTFSAVHVLGVQNKVADAISRFRWHFTLHWTLAFMTIACFGQHALKPILDFYIQRSSQSPIWLPSCLPSI